MSNKSIVFTKANVAEILDLGIPEIKEDEVLVKIMNSAISAGTERANITGDLNTSIYSKPATEAVFPRFGGYSSSGIVERVGDAVTTLNVGDRVALSWSTHAQYCAVKGNKAHKIPTGVSFPAASLVHISTFSAAAIRKCRLEFGESAIVMGLGVLGLISVSLLRAAGASPIIAVDPIKEKRERAISVGADYALDPFEPDFCNKVKELTDGGANVAIEVTGNGKALDSVLDCMKRYGRVALLGCTRNCDFTIDYYRKVHGPGITLIGAHTLARPVFESQNGWWSERDDAKAIIKLISTGRLDFDSLIEEIHTVENYKSVYERLIRDPSFPILIFDWSNFK